MPAMSKRLSAARRLLPYLILIGFVIVLEMVWGWGYLLSPWAEFTPAGGLVASLLLFASYGVRAGRLYDYFRADMRGHYLPAFRLMLLHNVFNNLLPMRSGEISFPVLMARYFGVQALRSVPALFWFRLLDLHTVLALGGLAWLLLAERPLWGWLAWMAWVPAPLLAFALQGWLAGRVARLPQGKPRKLLEKMLAGLPQHVAAFLRSWAWTWGNWGVKLLALAWVLAQFLPMPLSAAMVGAIAGDLTSVLPVHAPGGFGTYEAGVLAGLVPMGYPADAALPAAVNLHLFLLAASLVGGALAWLLPTPAERVGAGRVS